MGTQRPGGQGSRSVDAKLQPRASNSRARMMWRAGARALTVLVSAISDQPHKISRLGENRLDRHKIGGLEFQAKHPAIVSDMLRYAEPRADDHASHCRAVHYELNSN